MNTTGSQASGPSATFVDAKGRRWMPKLTARVLWEFEAATGVHLFESVFGLAGEEPEPSEEQQRMFMGVPEGMMRLALRLFGRPKNVAMLIYEGCAGRPKPAMRDFIVVGEDSGLLVRSVAAFASALRWLLKPGSHSRRVPLDDLGNAINSSRLMGEAIMVAYQAVLDFFPEMKLDAGQESGSAPFAGGAGKT